ncbi:MAG: cache domain-containing protein [Zoogloeaceae bacterium]|nr:cache domain-containing protein [Zoogloeaceae bacterium]
MKTTPAAGWIARARASVRIKLLALVLAPLAVGVPLLLGLVWTWGSEAYERLLNYKVSSDMVTAHEYFDRVREGVGADVMSIAGSHRLVVRLPKRSQADFAALLAGLAAEHGLDYLMLLDLRGWPVSSSLSEAPPVGSRLQWPVVAAAVSGAAHNSIEIFSPDDLRTLHPTLPLRAWVPLVPTVAAAPDLRFAEDRGMVIHAAAPVYDASGQLAGILEGGTLLNGNLGLVDRINEIVYQEGSLPLGSKGTATLFLGDTRIATNVRLFEGERALGTRVSQAVRDYVLGDGGVWLGTAFVVNDHYVSGYEPVVNGHGERVGMLYVGFLEAPLRAAMQAAMAVLFVIFLAISVIGTVLSLRWARSVFGPIERMNRVIQRIEQGDATARVGAVESRDELGRLAVEFDHLLDTLQSKREELQRWADELDRKVAERTAELKEANETLRRAQQQLVMSEKLAAIGELTAGVAHEVKNPVAVIQGNLDVLKAVLGPAAEPVRQEIRLIHAQVDRIRLIVTKLLQFARPGDFAGYTENVDVAAVIEDCLLLTRHNLDRNDIEVVVEMRAAGPVEINRGELQQVLINLLVNAAQAMPDGGTLTVASEDWLDEAGVPVGVLLHVRDTGVGIAPEHLANIFDPFFTTKKESGTGLGLSVTYTILERYGASIAVRSTQGEGTEFELRLYRQAVFQSGPEAPGFMRRWKG